MRSRRAGVPERDRHRNSERDDRLDRTDARRAQGPLETPLGYGGKANVTLRTLFETYGNIRPVRELPGVQTAFTGRKLDIVIVRENTEDLYAGIEYMQTPGVAEGLKLISREGCEKIVKLAFAFCIAEEREAVHCATKSNIMNSPRACFNGPLRSSRRSIRRSRRSTFSSTLRAPARDATRAVRRHRDHQHER